MKKPPFGVSRYIALVLVTQAMLGCGQQSSEEFITSGSAYLARRDYRAAVIQLKNAVQAAPDNGEARYLLGMALKGGGDLRSAEIELRKAASAGYSPDLVQPALVRVLLAGGQFEKALADASLSVTTTPANTELRALAGEAQLGLRRVEEAREAFASVLAVQPANDTATLGMARVAAISGDLTKAQELVHEVLGRSPSMTDALLLKADLLAAQGKAEEAVGAYDKAIAAEPLNSRTYFSVVALLLREGKAAAARERVEAMKKQAPRSGTTLYLDALVSYTQRDLAAARESVLNALRAAPDNLSSVLLAAAIAHDSGSYTQAEEYLKRVLNAYPNAGYPRRLLASTYLRTGQSDRAKEQVALLIKREPQNPAVLSLAGEVALANREVNKAAEYLQRALALDPKNVQSRIRLGQTRLAAGDTERAVQDLELASSTDAQQYQADVALVVLHLSRRELDKALDAAEVLAKKQPSNPITSNLRGLVYLAKKDRVRARSEFERALQLQPAHFPAAHNLAAMDVQDGRPDTARQRYERILAVNGQHEQTLLAIVNLLQQSRAPVEEIDKAIDRAVNSNPQSARVHLVKIEYALRRGDARAALAAAQGATATMPENARLLAALGRAQLAAGEANQAIVTFGKLAAMLPKSPAPLLAQASAFSASKDWADARRVLNKALELQPDSLATRAALLQTSVRAGELDRALSEARDMRSRWPIRPIGYVAEAEILQLQGNGADAERVLRQAYAKVPSQTLATAILRLLRQQGKGEEAETFAVRWMKEHPKDLVVPTFLAQHSSAAKDYTAAARWYRAALDASPDAPASLNNLAWTLSQLKDPAAISYARKAVSLAPNEPAILDTLGWIQVEQGQLDEGIQVLTRAQNLAPGAGAIQLNLAKALLKAGRTAEARTHLNSLMKRPPDSAIRKEAKDLLAGG